MRRAAAATDDQHASPTESTESGRSWQTRPQQDIQRPLSLSSRLPYGLVRGWRNPSDLASSDGETKAGANPRTLVYQAGGHVALGNNFSPEHVL